MSPALDLLALLALPVRPDREPPRLLGPSSLRHLIPPQEVPRRRSLACPEYDGCLDTAYRQRWRSWTCEGCPLFPLARAFLALEARRRAADRSVGDEA